jgi:hypothetical protein
MAPSATCSRWPRGKTPWMDPTLLGLRPEADGLLAVLARRRGHPWPGRMDGPCVRRPPTFSHCWHWRWWPPGMPSTTWPPAAGAAGRLCLWWRGRPSDYAHAIADGGLLALIACLGLAQLAHETTPSTAQLAFRGGSFFGVCCGRLLAHQRHHRGCGVGLSGLALSGAPSWPCCSVPAVWLLHCIRMAIQTPGQGTARWRVLARLHWPRCLRRRWQYAGPVALAHPVARRCRQQGLAQPGPPPAVVHLAGLAPGAVDPVALAPPDHQPSPQPAHAAAVVVCRRGAGRDHDHTPADRALLLALPALAALAAFALPTLQRSCRP